MKKLLKITIILCAFSFVVLSGNAQCKSFAKKVCKLELIPFVHDGIYNATILSEGETAELFKTFYSGQDYRIAICGGDDIPAVEFEVLDANREVLFSNKNENYTRVWDFKLESSQQLIISIQVQTSDDLSDEIASGCVAVLVGFMNVESSFEQF